jgi:hypothetical protein
MQKMNDALLSAREDVLHAFRKLAGVAPTLDEEDTFDLWDMARELEEVTEELVKNARAKMLKLVQTKGVQIPDGKGLQLVINGRRVECRRSRDGLDAKKVQAWLAKKGEAPERALAEKVTYAIAPNTEMWLKELGADDAVVNGLKVDEPTWSVFRPVQENDNE